jgi:fructose-1,6-bisphosphatase I/sedoheptulose-1,7-bisphosphatase
MTPMRTLLKYRATLTQYMIETRRQHPDASGEFNELVLGVAQACKSIAREVSRGAAADLHGKVGELNVQGEEQAKLDVLSNQTFIDTLEWTGVLAGTSAPSRRSSVTASTCSPSIRSTARAT